MPANPDKKTLGFQTEVKQLLTLMINSLYSKKEIFLRELISNASDALDKLRHLSLTQPDLLKGNPELGIWVEVDENARTLTIRDSGIGMTREEVIENLGTIAKSGTQEFLNRLSGEKSKDSALIGQFGVGFYSAFMVADKVTVKTRQAGVSGEHGVLWESEGTGEYTVETIAKAKRGTEVILHLRPSQDEFLESFQLRSLINRYSQHIAFPVYMLKEETPESAEKKEGEEENKPAAKKKPEYEAVNSAKALWTLPKKDITESEYHEFYKQVAHDYEDPLAYNHQRVEGNLEYTSLLFIPQRAPFDLWNRDRPRG